MQHGPLLGQVLTGRGGARGRTRARGASPAALGAEQAPLPRLVGVEIVTTPAAVGRRPRAFVRVRGRAGRRLPQPDGLERCPGSRAGSIVRGAPLDSQGQGDRRRCASVRRGPEDFLLLTEPELGEIAPRRPSSPASASPRAARSSRRSTTSYLLLGPESVPPPDGARRGERRLRASPPFEIVGGRLPGGVAELDEEPARAPAHPGGNASLRERDRRPRPAGRGGARQARGQLHQGLLPRAGARRPPALPRASEPGAAESSRSTHRRRPSRGRRSSTARRRSGGSRARSVVDGAVIALGYVRVEVPLEDRVGVKNGAPATMTPSHRARSSGDRAQPCGG